MSYVIRLVSAVCALSQSQSCLESWDLYLSMAALSVIKGFSFDSRSSFRLDENTIKIKHCILASSTICEIIYSRYLTSEIRALRWKTVVTFTPPTCSRAYFLGPPPPWNHHPWWLHMAQLNKCFSNWRVQSTHIRTTRYCTKNEGLPGLRTDFSASKSLG